jgi:hypothetical protein
MRAHIRSADGRTDMDERTRTKLLGEFGEVVSEHLCMLEYECKMPEKNAKCFDVDARKDKNNYLVAVKARNHTRSTGEEKKRRL